MPRILINEVDTSTTSGLATTTNAAYVPGYAIMGPINEPILCNSVAEFEDIFGRVPYYFEKDQEKWAGDAKPVDSTIRKGSAEKSYIYAHELLEQGLPVLFERLFDDSIADYFTAKTELSNQGAGKKGKMILTSKAVGKASFLIAGELVKKGTGESSYFELHLGVDAFDGDNIHVEKIEPAVTRFTCNYALSQAGNIAYYLDLKEDVLGLVDISFENLEDNDPDFTDGNSNVVKLQLVKDANGTVVFNNDEFTSSAFKKNNVELQQFTLVDVSSIPSGESKAKIVQRGFYTMLEGYSYTVVEGNNSVKVVVPSIFDKLVDKGEYVFKFLTSGAYPVIGYNNADKTTPANKIAKKMIEVASARGDVTALVDVFNEGKKIGAVHSDIVNWVKSPHSVDDITSEYGKESAFKYGAVVYPHGVYRNSVIRTNIVMPGSFGYLSALAVSVASNPNYYAIAGVKRGNPQRLISLCVPVTNAEAESVQPVDGISINPITNIKPYGLILWGNRTLYDSTLDGDLKASSFLNVRQLANDIKRTAFVASRELTFEQNNDILWINFKSKMTPLLDQMVSNGGIAGYELKRIATVKKATLKARIKVFAIEAVENFDLLLDISDNVLTVAE